MGKTGARALMVVAAILLMLAALATVYYLSSGKLLAIGGGTILGLYQVNVVSNDAHLNNAKAWVGSIALNGAGQSFVGSWDYTKTEFSNVIDPSTGQLMQPDAFTLSFDNVNQACQYPVATTGTGYDALLYPVMQKKDFSNYWLVSDRDSAAKTWCQGLTGLSLNGNLAYGRETDGVTYWCITTNTVGEVRRFGGKSYSFTSTMTLTTLNGTSSTTLSNQVQGATLYNNGLPVAYAAWAFNGVASNQCPEYSAEFPVWKETSPGGWNLVSQVQWNEWHNDWINSFPTWYAQHKTDGQMDYYVTYMQEDVNAMLTLKTNDAGFSSATMKGDSNNGYANIDETYNQVIVPVFAVDLNAAWVGIYQPCSQPSITQIDGSLVGTATQYQTGHATIKNTGTAQCSYTAYISTPSGISQVGSIPNFGIAGGQSAQISYQINSGQTVKGTCTLHVQGAGYCSDYKTSKDFWCEFDPYCTTTCSGFFTLNPNTCHCDCNIVATNPCQTVDKANCQYVTTPGCGSCTKTCPAPQRVNSQCTDCECGLDANAAPSGYFLNTTACVYQKTPIPPSPIPDWEIGLACGGGLLVIVGLILALSRRRK